jgi:lysophospholipase L1-like esterase
VTVPPLRFVAIGDSYTIGTATALPRDRWPDQLVARLGGPEGRLRIVANLAVNGYTSRDVIERELPALDGLRTEFASALIGVNDVVQGVPDATYARHVATILDDLLERLAPDRIVAVSTPDYTVTPQGAAYGDPAARSAAIRRFNGLFAAAAASRDVGYVDIHDISLAAATDRGLVAADGLHPSAAQYGLWVDRIAPVVERMLDG